MKIETVTTQIDGSPSCIQITPGTDPKEIDAFLNDLNRSIEELDVASFSELQKNYPFVKEAGPDPFFEEIKEKLKENVACGKSNLSKSDGFCHNCLMNEPVKIFGSGSSKVGIYYHFDSNTPIEIHSCTFCFAHKHENKEETEADYYTRMLSSKERDPKVVETVIRFGKLLKEYNLKESTILLRDKIEFEDVSADKTYKGKEAVYTALLNEEREFKSKSITINLNLVFYGNNDKEYDDIHQYHGLPGLLIKMDNIYVLWLVYSTDKDIFHLRSYRIKKEGLQEATAISKTNFYL